VIKKLKFEFSFRNMKYPRMSEMKQAAGEA